MRNLHLTVVSVASAVCASLTQACVRRAVSSNSLRVEHLLEDLTRRAGQIKRNRAYLKAYLSRRRRAGAKSASTLLKGNVGVDLLT